jgi:3-oxoacyl-[acyl-carrier protein] reductase
MDLGLANATAAVVGADIGDAGEVGKVFAELGERWDGELNVLINTVGPGAAGSFEDLTDEQWRQAVEDGVMGMVRCVPLVAFLASRRNSYMTGANINVDGGSDFT